MLEAFTCRTRFDAQTPTLGNFHCLPQQFHQMNQSNLVLGLFVWFDQFIAGQQVEFWYSDNLVWRLIRTRQWICSHWSGLVFKIMYSTQIGLGSKRKVGFRNKMCSCRKNQKAVPIFVRGDAHHLFFSLTIKSIVAFKYIE